MTRLLLLAAGLALFVYLLVELGPGAVLDMLGRVGWEAVPIALAYATYQAVRAVALASCVQLFPTKVNPALCGGTDQVVAEIVQCGEPPSPAGAKADHPQRGFCDPRKRERH